MIRDLTTGHDTSPSPQEGSESSPLQMAQALREAQETLRGYEYTALASIARSLSETAESLSRTLAEQQRAARVEWMDAEQAAEYVGARSKEVFEKIPDVPRHRLSPRVIRYSRRELDDWLLSR